MYGTGIGLVAMLFATGGPLVLAWLTRRGLGARAMRASLPVIIMLAALMALDGRLFSAVLGQRLLVLLPIALAGVLVGHRVAHRFSTERLRLVIYSLLTASGLLLVLNALNRLL